MAKAKSIFGRIVKDRSVYGLAILMAIVVAALSPQYMLMYDSSTYSDIAKSLASGQGYTVAGQPSPDVPMLPFFLAFFMIISGGFWMQAYLAVSAFFFVITTYYLAEEMRKGSGLISILLIPTLVLPVVLMLQILTDIVFVVFTNLAIIFLFRVLKKPDWKMLISMGFVIGLTYLIRPTGLFLIVYAALFVLFLFVKKKINIQKMLVVFVILSISFGAWEIIGGKASSISRVLIEKSKDSTVTFSLSDEWNGSIEFSSMVPFQLANLLRLIIFSMVFILPTMLYTAYKEMKTCSKENLLLLGLIGTFILPHLTVFPSFVGRYLLPLVPIFIVIFADYIRKEKKKSLVMALIVLHLIFAFGAYRWYIPRTDHLKSQVFYDSCEWVNDNIPGTVAVDGMMESLLHYYTGKVPVNPKNADYIIKSNINKPKDVDTGGRSVCKKYEDSYYWVEIWGNC